jgi:hypothetical protein
MLESKGLDVDRGLCFSKYVSHILVQALSNGFHHCQVPTPWSFLRSTGDFDNNLVDQSQTLRQFSITEHFKLDNSFVESANNPLFAYVKYLLVWPKSDFYQRSVKVKFQIPIVKPILKFKILITLDNVY